VFGVPLPAQVDDATPPVPSMTYGTHKRMAELALADAVRRGELDAIALRLPGVVARPGPSAGFKSAFLNELFWSMQRGERLVLPVSPGATSWLMSVRRCAANLVQALGIPVAAPVVTLPALRVRIDELVASIASRVGSDRLLIDYAPEPALEAQFGAYPPLLTPAADSLGFRHDGDLAALVAGVFSHLADKEPAIEACE
jgi:nucleoside-diphosphate-sugar epimerase